MSEITNDLLESNRWYNFDLIKGILVILVFIGHIVPGSLKEVFIRYFIYSFHMPLFIGVSGFLYNDQNSNKFIKYIRRIVIPWMIAVLIYLIIGRLSDASLLEISIKDIILAFMLPYYHLWFIIGYLSYLIITLYLNRYIVKGDIKHRWVYIIIILAVISIGFKMGNPIRSQI